MNLKNVPITLFALVWVLFAGVAAAQTSPTTPPTIGQSQPNNSPGLTTGLLSVTGLSTAGNIGGATTNFVFGGGGGQAAGLDVKRFALGGTTGAAGAPGATQWNAWGAFSRSNISYDFAPLQSSGSVNVYLGGVDYTFSNNVVFGVAVASDHTSVDLNFSGGKLSGSGWTVAPYLGMAFNKNLALDATLGYGRTNIDTAVAGVAGSTTDDRTLWAIGLTYRDVIGAWTLTGRGAFLGVHDKLGAYTLSNGTFVPDGTVNLSQFRLLGQVAYTAGNFTPYLSITYINDLHRPDQLPVNVNGVAVAAANDNDAWTPAIGIRFKADNAVYGSLQYSTEQSRSQVKNNQFLFNLGIRF